MVCIYVLMFLLVAATHSGRRELSQSVRTVQRRAKEPCHGGSHRHASSATANGKQLSEEGRAVLERGKLL